MMLLIYYSSRLVIRRTHPLHIEAPVVVRIVLVSRIAGRTGGKNPIAPSAVLGRAVKAPVRVTVLTRSGPRRALSGRLRGRRAAATLDDTRAPSAGKAGSTLTLLAVEDARSDSDLATLDAAIVVATRERGRGRHDREHGDDAEHNLHHHLGGHGWLGVVQGWLGVVGGAREHVCLSVFERVCVCEREVYMNVLRMTNRGRARGF